MLPINFTPRLKKSFMLISDIGPPIVAMTTQRPPRAIVARHLPRLGPATQSMATSTGWRASAAATSSLRWLITTSAPSRFTNTAFSSEPTVVTTFAPFALASWIAAMPSPLAPAWMKTVSPDRMPPSMQRLRYDVANASGIAAASAIDKPSGTGSTMPAGTATRSAYPPPPRSAQTLSPIFHRESEGACKTTPATSRPIHSGQPGGGGYSPSRWSRSARLSAAA